MALRAIASLVLMFAGTIYSAGQANNCDFPSLRNQQRDAATIQRLETAWSKAFLRGDTAFMSCLLAPDYTEIMRSGELKTLKDELAVAEKNRGKGLQMPALPRVQVLLHENAAVADGNEIVKNTDGKS